MPMFTPTKPQSLAPLNFSLSVPTCVLGFCGCLGFSGVLEPVVGSGDDCSEIGRFRRWLILLGSQWLLQGFQWDLLNEP